MQIEKNTLFETSNYPGGALLGRDTFDWIAGGNSAISHEISVSDWKQFAIEHETQWTGKYDTLFCVTYSALTCIGTLFTYYLRNNLVSAENVKWLNDNNYFKNGLINFNERFIGALGDTTASGAYQYKVANAIKNYGLIPQDMFPMAETFSENIDKKHITKEMYDLGKEFLQRFAINYEWSDISRLRNSPLQCVVRFANYNKPDDILSPAGAPNHAVLTVLSASQYNEIKDTYWQIYKRYNPAFTTSFMAFKLTNLDNNNMNVDKWIKDNDKKWVRNQNSGAFGRVLQGKLFVFQTTDRAVLALLDDRVRENGVQITQDVWESLPKSNF